MNVAIKPLCVDRETAAAMVSLSVSSMEAAIRAGTFPAPRSLTANRVGWSVRELEEWIETRPRSEKLPPEGCGKGRPRSAHMTGEVRYTESGT
jgi:prophage regulatory protein